MSARDQVLYTSELLDEVVGHLDWRTALTAQRVSRLWHDVIRSGTSIQHRLGLKIIDKRQRWALKWNTLGMYSSAHKINADEAARLASSRKELIVTCGRATDVFAQFAKLGVGRLHTQDYGNEYIFRVDAIPRALFRLDHDACWRRMQITQPPTTTAHICTIKYYRDSLMYRRIPGHHPVSPVYREKGITIEDVMAVVKEWTNDPSSDINWLNERFALTTVHMLDDDEFLHRLSQSSFGCG